MMARSPLSGGVERAPLEPEGRDPAALGPSDSTDSGSDIAGIDALDTADPALPVDAGGRAGADVSVDRIFDPLAEGELDEDEDPDLAFVDAAASDGAPDEEEDEDADPVGDGVSDANLAG